jgi:uncharacterized protein (UPF0335 family)
LVNDLSVSENVCKERVKYLTSELSDLKTDIKELRSDFKVNNLSVSSKLDKIIGNDLSHVNARLTNLEAGIKSIQKNIKTISDDKKALWALIGNLITLLIIGAKFFMGA